MPKRRPSKPIPPALVIEPPAPSSDEKKDESAKPVPPEVNRLTEFAEFATSPHSPLVQSPFPLTLTPGLLGAGSTPDWMTKSFTRFFFPDKPHSVRDFYDKKIIIFTKEGPYYAMSITDVKTHLFPDKDVK